MPWSVKLALGVAIVGMLVACLVMIAMIDNISSSVEKRAPITASEIREFLMKGSTMQTLKASWCDEHGVTHTVETTRILNESNTAFIQRHADAVSDLQKVYPPKQ